MREATVMFGLGSVRNLLYILHKPFLLSEIIYHFWVELMRRCAHLQLFILFCTLTWLSWRCRVGLFGLHGVVVSACSVCMALSCRPVGFAWRGHVSLFGLHGVVVSACSVCMALSCRPVRFAWLCLVGLVGLCFSFLWNECIHGACVVPHHVPHLCFVGNISDWIIIAPSRLQSTSEITHKLCQ